VYGPSYIEVKDGRESIKKVKRPHMSPGEMERVRINRSNIEKMKGSDLIVEAVGVEG
jgi:hypothetical protein